MGKNTAAKVSFEPFMRYGIPSAKDIGIRGSTNIIYRSCSDRFGRHKEFVSRKNRSNRFLPYWRVQSGAFLEKFGNTKNIYE